MQVTISEIIISLYFIEIKKREKFKNIKKLPIIEAASRLVLEQHGIFEKRIESKLSTLKQNNLQLGNVAFILFEFTV